MFIDCTDEVKNHNEFKNNKALITVYRGSMCIQCAPDSFTMILTMRESEMQGERTYINCQGSFNCKRAMV